MMTTTQNDREADARDRKLIRDMYRALNNLAELSPPPQQAGSAYDTARRYAWRVLGQAEEKGSVVR